MCVYISVRKILCVYISVRKILCDTDIVLYRYCAFILVGKMLCVYMLVGKMLCVYMLVGKMLCVYMLVEKMLRGTDAAYRCCGIQRMCGVYTVESSQLVLACRRAYLLRSEAHDLRFCPIFAPYVSSRSLPVGIQSLWLEVWATRSRDHNYT